MTLEEIYERAETAVQSEHEKNKLACEKAIASMGVAEIFTTLNFKYTEMNQGDFVGALEFDGKTVDCYIETRYERDLWVWRRYRGYLSLGGYFKDEAGLLLLLGKIKRENDLRYKKLVAFTDAADVSLIEQGDDDE
jgi:hypothetical protein